MDTSLCDLPRDTLVDIDFSYWLGPREDSYYLFYLNGEIFVVQGPPATYEDENELITAHDKTRDRHLRAMLQQMETLAIKTKNGSSFTEIKKTDEYRVLPKRKTWTMYEIKVPLWLRKVQESELQLIRWVGCGRCLCRLDGVEVDVDIAWDLLTFKKMERIMVAVKELSELDLCYKPVAHILRGNDVIGIAFERQSGRPMQYVDKRLFYSSMCQLHERSRPCRLYLRYPYFSDYWIQDGKLRVYHHLWGFNVRKGRETGLEAHDEDAALKTMDKIFHLLKQKGNNPGEDRYGNGDPLILAYAQMGREHPLRNPVVKITINPPVYTLVNNTSLSPRRMNGWIRFNRPVLSGNGDSSMDAKPPHYRLAPVRKSFPLIASHCTSKRSRLDSQAIPSESRVVETDDTETIGSGDGDDETLVDEDGSISGYPRFSSISTIRSVNSI
ncbi:hypothetical protein PM082_019881 [Marasmius tenuissimus]|nr:hypothetical protein PM082_019881 [Marasmius tenuissimus]